jgi:hypothetical protein
VRFDLGLLEDRAAVRSPRAFEPRSVSAGADSAAYGVCERHRRRAIPEHIAEFHGAARRKMPASFE